MILVLTEAYEVFMPTKEARKLENERPPTPKQRKKEQHISFYIHVPIVWNFLYS